MEIKEIIRLKLMQTALEDSAKDSEKFNLKMKEITQDIRNYFGDSPTFSNVYLACEAIKDYLKHVQENILNELTSEYNQVYGDKDSSKNTSSNIYN